MKKPSRNPRTALSIFQPGQNCWKISKANNVRLIIDSQQYFADLKVALKSAREQVVLVGWDFDTRISLDGAGKGAPLGDFVWKLVQRNRNLNIYILNWNFGSIKTVFRGRMIFTLLKWMANRRITVKFDSAHPVGASHHQKLIVIDGSLALCGGIDVSSGRWDTREHRDEHPQRRNPDGKAYDPWHDISLAVDGKAAATLHELAQDRWMRATGKSLPMPQVKSKWPFEKAVSTFKDTDIAISRTRGKYDNCAEIRENEALFLDSIASARKFIYAENQYFASKAVAAAIAKRLSAEDPPEVVIVMPEKADGWLEQVAMDTARSQLVALIRRVDRNDRFRIYHPFTKDGAAIYVHAKLSIVDDRLLRVGSSNMNNRSMGLDTECDLAFEGQPGDRAAAEINAIRVGLLAEHLGADAASVQASLNHSSMIETIEKLRGEGRSLRPYVLEETTELTEAIASQNLLDPLGEDEGEIFEKVGDARR